MSQLSNLLRRYRLRHRHDSARRRFVHGNRWRVFEQLESRALLAADLRVTWNAEELFDGLSNIDLGTTTPYQMMSLTLTLQNEGDEDLLLDSSSLNLPFGFTLMPSFPEIIYPGQQDFLMLQFDAWQTGLISGTLSFATNDPIVDVFQLDVTGVVDTPPEMLMELPPFEVAEGSEESRVDLYDYFVDNQPGESLTFFAYSSDNSLVTVYVDNETGELLFDYPAEVDGVATITIGAVDSNGLITETTVDVTVTGVNDAPIATPPEGPYLINEFSGSYAIPLQDLFSDPDSNWNDLMFEVTDNSNPAELN